MSKKKYLIYLDILGFEELAREIGQKKGIGERIIRKRFIDVIRERVKVIETNGRIIGKYYGSRDDWLLVTDSLDGAFRVILEILEHNTEYEGYESIPLEIGLGIQEYDKWAKFTGEKLIIEDKTIRFLKTNILYYYRNWYKKQNNGKRIKSTFIVLTEPVYQELESLDRKECRKIEYEEKKENLKFFIIDVERVLRRGRISDFLEKIGYPGSKLYGRIDEVYVPPVEYEDIQKTLKRKRIVFITGTREYGKTYTAVKLMWEYYIEGYEPRWIEGGELTERRLVRRKLENIREELKSKNIIYFEDPFGKTRYEKREGLEREIGLIIENVNQVEGVYVIITSREEVFKEFEKEKLSKSDIREFERSLNLKKPSYGYKKRKEILLKWAEKENCKWLKNENLKTLVLKSLKDKKILPTPLSIRDFAIATVNINIKNQLKKRIEEKSEETAKAFAREINSMSDDKVLFLSFLFISNHFKNFFVKRMYNELVKELNLPYAWNFDRILNWFMDDKINTSRDIEIPYYLDRHSLKRVKEIIEIDFLEYLEDKIERGEDTDIPGYAVEILKQISPRSKNTVGMEIPDYLDSYYFDRVKEMIEEDISKCVKNMFCNDLSRYLEEKINLNKDIMTSKHSDYTYYREHLNFLDSLDYKTIYRYMDESQRLDHLDHYPLRRVKEIIEIDFLEYLEDKIERGEDTDIPGYAIEILKQISDKIERGEDTDIPGYAIEILNSKDDRGDLCYYFLDKTITVDITEHLMDKIGIKILKYITDNIEIVEERQTLYRLYYKIEFSHPSYSEALKYLLAEDNYFNSTKKKIFGKLLLKIADKNKVIRDVARVAAKNFTNLPEDIRNELLLKLSKKYEAAEYVAFAIAENFDKLPENIRNLLLKFSEKEETVEYVARAVTENFDKLPENIRNLLLLKLSEKNKAAEYVAFAIAENFDKLPENIRNLLLKLSKKYEAAEYVAFAIAENFDKLPENIRNLLLKFSEKEETVEYVARAVTRNFDKLPEDVRNELLLKLSEKNKSAGYVARFVTENFDKLPEDVRNELLLKLSEKNKSAGYVARLITRNSDKLPEDIRNELLLETSQSENAAKCLARFVTENFNELPEDIRNELLLRLSEKHQAATHIVCFVTENFNKLPEDVRNELLLRLSERYKIAKCLARFVTENFNKLPEDMRNELLLRLSEKHQAATHIVCFVTENFNKLPEDVRNELLLKLSKWNKTAEYVIISIAENFDKLPENIRNLLLKFSEKYKTAEYVAQFITKTRNFNKLPEDIRNELLLKFSEKYKTAEYVARFTRRNSDKLPEDIRNELLLKLSKKSKIIKI